MAPFSLFVLEVFKLPVCDFYLILTCKVIVKLIGKLVSLRVHRRSQSCEWNHHLYTPNLKFMTLT